MQKLVPDSIPPSPYLFSYGDHRFIGVCRAYIVRWPFIRGNILDIRLIRLRLYGGCTSVLS
jgi:hypothetical protein